MKKINFLALLVVTIFLSGCVCKDTVWQKHKYSVRTLATPYKIFHKNEFTRFRGYEEYKANPKYNKPYSSAYVTPQGNKIIEVIPTLNTSTASNFNVTLTILSPSNNLNIKHLESESISMIKGKFIKFDKIDISKEIPTHNSHLYPFYVYKLTFTHGYYKTIKHISMSEGDTYLGEIPFSIDGEDYRYNYSVSLYYETSPGQCSFNPAP